MKKEKWEKIYKKVLHKNPVIQNALPEYREMLLENFVQQYIFKRQLLIALVLFLFSLGFYYLSANLSALPLNLSGQDLEGGEIIIRGIGGLLSIISVCVFAKTMHDPLTPAEALALIEKETKEKTGE